MSATAVYRIETVLEMKGNVTSALTKVAEGFEKVDKLSRDAAESISGISKALRGLQGLSRTVGTINEQLKKMSEIKIGVSMGKLDAAETAMKGLAAQQAQIASSARTTATAWQAATGAINAAATASGRVRNMPGPGTNARGGNNAGVGNTGQGGNNNPPVNAPAGSSHRPDWLGASIGLQIGGERVTGMVERMLHAAMEPEHIEKMLKGDDRVTDEQILAVRKAAMDGTVSAPGTTYGKNMEAILDLKNITGSLDEAIKIMPGFAKMSAVLASVDRNHGGSGDPAFAAAKALEILGKMTDEKKDPVTGAVTREISGEELNKHLADLTKVAFSTQGRVNPLTWLALAKQARTGGMLLNDEFLFQELPAMMLSMGGDRPGTAIQSLSQIFVGHKMTQKSYEVLMDMGLASKAGLHRVMGRNGKMHTVVDPSKAFEADVLEHNPAQWSRDAMAVLGRDHKDADGKLVKAKSMEEMLSMIQQAIQRGPAAGFLADMFKDMPGIVNEKGNLRHTTQAGMDNQQATDPLAKMIQFHAAVDKLMVTLGGDMLPAAMSMLDKLTSVLNGLSAWAQANPKLATTLAEVTAGLGTLALAVGTIGGGLILAKPVFELLGLSKAASVVAPAAAGASTATTAAGAGLFGLFTAIMSGAAVGGLGAMWGVNKLGYGDNLNAGIDGVNAAATPEGRAAFANNWANGGKDAFLRGLNPFSSDPHPSTPGGMPPDVAAGLARMASPPPPPPPQPVTTTVNLNVDGKTLASVVEQHMATGLSAPNAGTSHFDAAGTRVDPGNVGH